MKTATLFFGLKGLWYKLAFIALMLIFAVASCSSANTTKSGITAIHLKQIAK